MLKQALSQFAKCVSSNLFESRCQNERTRKPLSKKILRFEAMEDRCMLAVDSGIGAFACDAFYGPQTQETWIGQYAEQFPLQSANTASQSSAATFEQLDLALDEMLGDETSGYYATVATFEESEVYTSLMSSVTEENSILMSQSSGPYIIATVDQFMLRETGNPSNFVAYDSGSFVDGRTTLYVVQSGGHVSLNIYAGASIVDETWSMVPYTAIVTCDEEATYWQYNLGIWTWTLPANMTNSTAKRDFTFTFIADANNNGICDSGEPTQSLNIHIDYVEVLVDFAGSGNYRHTTTAGGQTASNTVIVGQKVSAKIESSLEIVSCGFSGPSGGNYVKDYITTNSVGQVVTHSTQDYYQEQFDFYYTNKGNNQTAGIGAFAVLRDANGKTYNRSDAVAYYLDTPTATLTAISGYMGIHNDNVLQWGNSDSIPQVTGMTFIGTVTAPAINGAGECNFVQTVVGQRDRIGANQTPQEISSHNETVLDTRFPYNDPEFENHGDFLNDPDRWRVAAGSTLGQNSTPYPFKTTDSPRISLNLGNPNQIYTQYNVNDDFMMYIIYKPDGNDSIWVPLQQLHWVWNAEAKLLWDPNEGQEKWIMTESHSLYQATGQTVTTIPQWSNNIDDIKGQGGNVFGWVNKTL